MKAILARIALVVFGLALLFACLEVGFRVHAWLFRATAKSSSLKDAPEDLSAVRWTVYDKDVGYLLRPNVGGRNEHGLKSHPIGPKSERFRVLVLGDSVIFNGRGVEDTLVGKLESYVSRDPSFAPSEWINAGVPGWTNYQELAYLKKYGVVFLPDLVGVVFVLNDLHKFLHDPLAAPPSSGLGALTPEAKNKGGGSWVVGAGRRSFFLRWLKSNLAIVAKATQMIRERGYTFDYREDFHNAWVDESWNTIETQLREMVQLGERSGFGVFLVVVPFADQFREDYLARDAVYVTKPQRMLKTICGRLGIPFLDLMSHLAGEKSFREDRIHLTAEGRAVAAESIAEFLRREHLLPIRQGRK